MSPRGYITEEGVMGLWGARTAEEFAARRGKSVLFVTAAFAVYAVQACRAVALRDPIGADASGPSVGLMSIVVWAVWALALASWVFATPGHFRWNRRERGVLNDEFAQHLRTRALRVAFAILTLGVVAQVLGIWLWSLPVWWPLAALSAALVAGAVVSGVGDVRANG